VAVQRDSAPMKGELPEARLRDNGESPSRGVLRGREREKRIQFNTFSQREQKMTVGKKKKAWGDTLATMRGERNRGRFVLLGRSRRKTNDRQAKKRIEGGGVLSEVERRAHRLCLYESI